MEAKGVVLGIANLSKLDQRLAKALSKYEIERHPDDMGVTAVPVETGRVLASLFDSISILEDRDLSPPCNRCWEIPQNDGFHSHGSLGRDLLKLENAYAGRAERLIIGRSFEGRELWCLRIGAPSGTKNPRRILLVGCHHAAEWISVEVPLLFAQSILGEMAGEKAIEDCEFDVVPMLNPDGHMFSVNYDRAWRKSRVSAVNPQGVIDPGVDLNRNYPLSFGDGHSQSVPGDSEYCGPKALSEPETSALAALCTKRKYNGALSFHAYGREILYPWSHKDASESGPEIAGVQRAARAMALAIQAAGGSYVAKQGFEHYNSRVGGDFSDWIFSEFGTLALTIEVGTSDYEMRLPANQIQDAYNELRSGFSEFIAATR